MKKRILAALLTACERLAGVGQDGAVGRSARSSGTPRARAARSLNTDSLTCPFVRSGAPT